MVSHAVARSESGHGRRLSLSVQYAVHADGLPSRASVRHWVRAVCGGAAQVAVRFVAEQEGRALNRAYRGKDYATNVLSFAYSAEPLLTGDLVVCAPVAMREAAGRGKPADAHFAHLIVHGMLHLQGYDHEVEADAAVMELRERIILSGLGYPDPYEGER
ncbi:MAG: rRNA maturation RNase YbeY [Sterolibacteriaceae bacterium]|jgi:probable rRNA maturation factor|nr:rRNA maturation RNase YbeY [Sterolibacteriaceae bacterium]MBK9086489.1 rRNA maturation RNase YbeY [Sterolibacteriaceae bacterium]